MSHSVKDTIITSEYRSHNTESINLPDVNPSNLPTTRPTKSYASATMNNIFPSKEQAIIIDAVEDSTMKDYAQAIAKCTGTNAIRFASRISNSRICIYLDSITTAKNFVTNNPKLLINNTYTTVRPLLNPAQRIILSNVCPSIPHEFIENILKGLNIKISSKMSFLRAGIQDASFSHVMSFRRQIFINPEDVTKIPDSLLILHDNTQYRIFISKDNVSCFLCKREGHIAKQCDNVLNTLSTNINENIGLTEPNTIHTTYTNSSTNDDMHKADDQTEPLQQTSTNNQGNKRARSTTTETSIISSNSEINPSQPNVNISLLKNNITTPPVKKVIKRRKIHKEAIKNIKDMLKPAENTINDTKSNFPLSFVQLTSFLENVFGVDNPLETAYEYTQDIPSLINMLIEVYPLLKERSIKNRIHRITKKLNNNIENPALISINNIPLSSTPVTTDYESDININNPTTSID